jgi:hypothetical protein
MALGVGDVGLKHARGIFYADWCRRDMAAWRGAFEKHLERGLVRQMCMRLEVEGVATVDSGA